MRDPDGRARAAAVAQNDRHDRHSAMAAVVNDAAPTCTVVGEALIDIVHPAPSEPSAAHPGGSPANVSIALGRLGRKVTLVTQFGNDRHGDDLRAWLARSGVTLDLRHADQTSTARAHLDERGAATYEFDISWSPRLDDVRVGSFLHTGSLATTLEPGSREVFALLDRASGMCPISYDPNIRPSLVDDADAVRDRVRHAVSRADVVKASDEDVAWLYPGEPLDTVMHRWLRSGPTLVVITAGAEGARAMTEHHSVMTPAPRITVVDTVGAGDTFMGALIDGLMTRGVWGPEGRKTLQKLDQPELASTLERAARAAAHTVSRAGTDPPTAAELDATSRSPHPPTLKT